MLGVLARVWHVAEREPKQPDVIIPLGYGSVPGRLANGTREGLEEAIRWAKKFPKAIIAFGNANHCFPGSEEFERREKMQIVKSFNFPYTRVISAGPIENTVTELRAVEAALAKHGMRRPGEILLIIEELHSRSGLYIARRVFPRTKISLKYSGSTGVQPDHVFPLQRKQWKWFGANIARQIALRTLGIDRVSKIRHQARR